MQKSELKPNQNYLEYVKSFAAPTQHFKTCYRAFIVGGGSAVSVSFSALCSNTGRD